MARTLVEAVDRPQATRSGHSRPSSRDADRDARASRRMSRLVRLVRWFGSHLGSPGVSPRFRRFLLRVLDPFFVRRPFRVQGQRMFFGTAPPVLFSPDMVMDRFEPATTRLFKQLVRPGMTVLDIGAHVGYYTLLAARLVGPSGHVLSFEAERRTFELLRRNVALNRHPNVEAFQQAIGDRSGTVAIHRGSPTGAGAGRFNRTYGADEADTLKVICVSVDDFLRARGWPRVDVVKVDIDGAEPLALAGMREFIARQPALRMIIEYYPEGLRGAGTQPAAYLRTLSEFGFSISVINDEGDPIPLPAAELAARLAGRQVANLFCEKT